MDKTETQAELLFSRLKKRFKHLSKWARRTGTNAFRLYDRDIPEIPLVLDLYDDIVSGAIYRRPYEKSEDEEGNWIFAMKEAAGAALGIPEENIFIKERSSIRNRRETGKQYVKMSEKNIYRDVREGELLFRVNLSDYLDTGLFLDARKKRFLIKAKAAGKKLLNLFAYTCSLSAAAAKGGAAQVDSVDLSNTYLEWGKVNFALNRLKGPGGFSFIRDDALNFIREAAEKRQRWDLILLDPPVFSNSNKMKGTLDIKRDYKGLIRRCLSLLSPGGSLYFSTSARGFIFDGALFPGFAIRDLGKELEDEDFRGKRTPLNMEIRKTAAMESCW